MSADDTIRRGARAREILADPLVAELLAAMHEQTIAKWRAAESAAAREAYWNFDRAVTGLEAMLRGADQDGRMTEQRLEDERAEAEAERKQRER